MKQWRIFFLALAAGLSLSGTTSRAGWELPAIISSGMVLQRDAAVPLWGWDEPGTTVTVFFRDQKCTTQAGADGQWRLRIPAGPAGGPFLLRIQGV